MHLRRNLALLLLATTSCGISTIQAQTIDDLRQSLRDSLQQAQFASGLAGLIALSDELELSGASYWVNNDTDTRLSSLGLPYQHTYRPWSAPWPGIHVEGVVGYARAKQDVDDIWSGALPGLETSVASDTVTYGGLVGLGPAFQLAERLTLAAIGNGGVTHLNNDATYSGPGAPISSALLDGLALNWSANMVSYGGALRMDWQEDLGGECLFELVMRYDIRWINTFDATDVAQEFTSRMQTLTLRADVTGPTGWSILSKPVGWRATLGYRYFIEGDMYDLRNIIQVGGGIELDTDGILPLGPRTSLSAGLIVGPDVLGYTVGLGFTF